jgi:23S rRNA pseudouridine1911/1915/1917 synthase
VDDLPQRLDFDSATRQEFPVPPEEAGARLDICLARRLPEFSRAAIQRLVRRGSVLLNGAKARPSTRVRAGDRVAMEVPAIRPPTVEPEALPLSILKEDEAFVAIDKASGIAVHPGRGRPGGTVANAIAHRYGMVALRGGAYRPGIVHRLDLETSGVMVIAKTEVAHARLSAAFHAREVAKEYRAIVFGDPAHEEDRIDLPLGRDLVHPTRIAVRFDGGRDAQTVVSVVERFGAAAHLLCRPLTGRTHQIRVHLASRGHPILGDSLYAARRQPPVPVPRLMLHAFRLTFPHPLSGEDIEVEAPLPADFRAVLAALRAREMQVGGAPPKGSPPENPG